MKRLLQVIFLVVVASTATLSQSLIRVPQDQPTVQAGINAAVNGDTVLVDVGIYTENITINKKIVLGSWFILNGDTARISQTILDGGTPAHPDSASVIRILAGTDSTTVITGFTIRNGHGTKLDLPGSYDWLAGGGIRFFAGGARITHNIISGNTLNSSLGVYGGGIALDPVTGPLTYWIVEYNQIINNTITSTGSDAEGAGVWMTEDGRFTNNEVSQNVALSSSSLSAGGGIFLLPLPGYGTATIVIADNLFRENQAMNGGCFWMGAHTTLTPRPIVTLQNNLILGNIGSSGSAMNIVSGDFILVNNTIAGNTGSNAIRLFDSRGSLTFKLLNNIVWNPGIYGEFNSVVNVTGSYNNVRGGLTGEGNINSDPLFVSSHRDSLGWFQFYSSCRDAGAASATVGGTLLAAPPLDFYKHARDATPDIGAFEAGVWSSTEESSSGIPTDFVLGQNYPNPFNPATVISYRLSVASNVRLTVYDLLGREVATLVNEKQPAGVYKTEWDASRLPSGVYFYRLIAAGFVETKKMVLLK